MSNPESTDSDFIKTMYDQLWQSQREGVRERLQFTSIFAAILTGFFALIKDPHDCRILPLYFFLMLFSIFSLLFTMKAESVVKARERAADGIEDQKGFRGLGPRYSEWIPPRVQWISIGRLFPVFFFMCFCFLLFFPLRLLIQLTDFQAFIISFVLFMIVSIYLLSTKYIKDEEKSSPRCVNLKKNR